MWVREHCKKLAFKLEDAEKIAICALDGDRLCGVLVSSIESIDEDEAAEAMASYGEAAAAASA